MNRPLCSRKVTCSCVCCAAAGRESCSSCCYKMFLRLWMFELNCEAQMRFSLVVSEKTKQLNINFYETLCTHFVLHRSTCVSQPKCKQAEMMLRTWAAAPVLLSATRIRTTKGETENRTSLCCLFLVCHAICSSSLKKDELKSQQTKCLWFAYWMCLDTSVWFQTFYFLLTNIFPPPL